MAFYTIGQRKGLGISSQNPLYVINKDIERNTIIVGSKDDLGYKELFANKVNWVSGNAPDTSFQAEMKIRYKAREASGTVYVLNEKEVQIVFDDPLLDITPGQAVVFYDQDIVIGGGTIISGKNNLIYHRKS